MGNTIERSKLEKQAKKLGVFTVGRTNTQIKLAIKRKKSGKKRKGKLD